MIDCKLLAVTSDVKIARQVQDLTPASFTVLHARSASAGESLLRSDRMISMILTDHTDGGEAPLRLLQFAQEHCPDARRGLITMYGQLAQIIQGLHTGAVQFVLQRPLVAAEYLPMIGFRTPATHGTAVHAP